MGLNCQHIIRSRHSVNFQVMRIFFAALLAASSMHAQDAVTIRVDASKTVGAFKPIYGYFGYDEPNFTYAKNGRKLVGELARLSNGPVYIRTHFMLTTGDGTPGFNSDRPTPTRKTRPASRVTTGPSSTGFSTRT
jgi:hypothetical protein